MAKMAKQGKKEAKLEQQRARINEIMELFKRARKAASTNQSQANLYLKKALRLRNRYRIRLPAQLKRTFCKHCKTYWMPGKNVRIRIRPKTMIYFCETCKRVTRRVFKK